VGRNRFKAKSSFAQRRKAKTKGAKGISFAPFFFTFAPLREIFYRT